MDDFELLAKVTNLPNEETYERTYISLEESFYSVIGREILVEIKCALRKMSD